MQIHRGDIVLVDLDPVKGSEQGKTLPAVVVQNNIGNQYAPTLIIIPLTSNIQRVYPTDVLLKQGSKAVASQIRTVDKIRIQKVVGQVLPEELYLIDNALRISLNL